MRRSLLLVWWWWWWTGGAGAICPPRCVCNDETLVVTCNNTNLDMIPITLNPGVKQLFLTHGHIKTIIAALGFYKDLEYLDLSHNQLVTIDSDAFEAQQQLRVLRLGRNSISGVLDGTFRGLRGLQVLELNDNILDALPDRAFVHLNAVEELDLSANRIATVASEAFRGLDALRTLRLRDNRLKNVPTDSFAPLSRLSYLDLGVNMFGTLVAASFEPLTSLERLALDGCGLRDIPENAFRGLENLRVLRLHDNLLGDPPTGALQSLTRLEELSLGQNLFDELGAHTLRGLRTLRVLEVSAAPRLTIVRRLAFASNPDLDTVRLTHNPKLAVLEAGAFDGVPHLRHLSLRGDAFVSFGEELLAWDELDSVDLRDNPLECNCSLLWLRNLLQSRNLSRAYDAAPVATCGGPGRVRLRNLAELSADDLSCYFADARQQAIVGVVAGAVVAAIATLILVVFKYRRRVTTALKDKWSDGALRRKEHQYEKTNDEEENNILHAAQQSLKMTPVTEL